MMNVIRCFLLVLFLFGAVTSASAADRPLILAHYMPWYSAPPDSPQWGWHWTMNHFDPDQQTDGRRQIASKFYPLIGPYDSGDPHVIECHLLLMHLAGIDGIIVDWYGRSDFRDYPILHRNTTRALQQCERLRMKFVICYEDQTIPALVEGNRLDAGKRVAHAVDEIQWLNKYWFQSGAYARQQKQPALLSFGHGGLTNEEWQACIAGLGFDVAYYSQDYRREGAIGGFGWPVPQRGAKDVDRFAKDSVRWPAAIPVAFPRFVDVYRDAKVNDGYSEIPDNEGATFRSTLQTAFQVKHAPMIQLATWNDWGEGTQIEPSREFGFRDLEVIQSARRQSDVKWTARPADLKLPIQLLELRRAAQDKASHDKFDEIAEQIRGGRMGAARQALGN